MFKEIHFPHSLGLLYRLSHYYTGLKVNSGVQADGPGPYGEPRFFRSGFSSLIDLKPTVVSARSLLLRLLHGLTMTNRQVLVSVAGPHGVPKRS